ncbi:MAG: bifunctional demethylmenaquinone methyltransferase/2-methoxy-6-polyprenyl-1,4-benzoquinol methylase UbiE [Spirochaetaceae bacterium]|nr:bifunctional demethylmenaquinone methyltransferase/2-methoxy-6-polyprenyl-1,4-benzoquinol methylase UbiE [Spirochaetaceae bacterium]
MAPVAGTSGVPLLVRTRAADRIGAMFNGLARRYDLLNRVLSLQRDQRWRRLAAQLVLASRPRTVLDVATGTADLPLMLTDLNPQVRVTGVDIATGMLARGRIKARHHAGGGRVELRPGNALALPVADSSVDAVTIAFGIRNVADYRTALNEMHRVLRPSGVLAILEFALPSHPLVRLPYLVYFRHLLPMVGGLISGNASAYRYLNRSVESFPSGPAFSRLLTQAGFQRVRRLALTFGIAAIYCARKPA